MIDNSFDMGSIVDIKKSGLFVIEYNDPKDEFNYQVFTELTKNNSKYRIRLARDGFDVGLTLEVTEYSDYIFVDQNKKYVEKFDREDSIFIPKHIRTIGQAIKCIEFIFDIKFKTT